MGSFFGSVDCFLVDLGNRAIDGLELVMKLAKIILLAGIVLCFTVSCPAMLDMTFMPRWLVWAGVAMVLTILLTFKRSLEVPKNLIIPAFGAYLIMAIISLARAYNMGEGVFEVCKITLMFVSLIIISSIVKDIKDVAKPLTILALIIGLYGLYYICFVWRGQMNNFATMGNKNIWGHANLLLLPFCLYVVFRERRLWRNIGVFASLLILVNIVIPGTRSALLGLAASITVVIFIKGRSFALCGLFVVFIIFVPTMFHHVDSLVDTTSMKERFGMWRQTVRLTTDKFMVGAGNWQVEIPNYATGFRNKGAFRNAYTTRPHNDYLWVAAELSPVGLVFYVLIFGLSIFYARNNPYVLMGLISYMVIAFFSFPKERASLSMMLILFIALAMGGSQRLNKQVVTGCVIAICLLFVMRNFIIRSQAEYLSGKIFWAHAKEDWPQVVRLTNDFILPSYINLLGTPVYYYRGIAYEQLGDYKNALFAYAKAGQAHINHLFNLCGLGLCYYHQGKYPESIVCYQKALAIKPDFEGAKHNLKIVTRAYLGTEK